MKKIALGLNIFGKSNRTDLALASMVNLKKQFTNIDLYNLQFVDQTISGRLHDDFTTFRCLKETSKDYISGESKRTIPMLKELFDSLASLDYEYFCFTNNDIIISDRYFKFVDFTDYDTYPTSRLAIEPIK